MVLYFVFMKRWLLYLDVFWSFIFYLSIDIMRDEVRRKREKAKKREINFK